MNIILIIGLIGALLMFSGDMLIFYHSENTNKKEINKMDRIISIMKEIPKKRLIAGGIISPVATFLYCIGFYHIILITNESHQNIASLAFFCLFFGVIAGGIFHSHFVYLGLLGENKKSLNIVIDYFKNFSLMMYISEGIGFVILLGLIITGNTELPQWMFVLTPGILFLLSPIVGKLPEKIRTVVAGGWSNLISIIYYISVIIYIIL